MTTPIGIDLDQYKAQAKDLLKQALAEQPEALTRFKTSHPEQGSVFKAAALKLADAQLVVARENGFASWPKFRQYILFRNAVKALDNGDVKRLDALLTKHPWLTHYRCRHGEWYEEGYFAGATLLNHVAGNPIRSSLPRNIVEIARLLIDRGFDPQAAQYTVVLVLTGKQPSEAGVALPLIDLLVSAGAKLDLKDGNLLTMPLLNGGPDTAAALVARGAIMGIEHLAAMGDTEGLVRALEGDPSVEAKEMALVFACIRGQAGAARLLIANDAKGDVLLRPGNRTPRTALHEAANRGHIAIVEMLLAAGADSSVVEPNWGGTAAGWAAHDGHADIVDLLQGNRSAS